MAAPRPAAPPRRTPSRARGPVPAAKARVRLELLTDPWSVWCWGFEPVRRAIELRHPTIAFEPLVGGMFPQMPDPATVGFDLERFFGIVQHTTGMPIDTEQLLTSDRPESTYPACTFVHAMRILDPTKEHAYLRAMREAAYLDRLNVSRPEVAARVAARIGVDPERFRGVLESGEPEAEFRRRLSQLHARQLHAYPTLLVTHEERVARVEGFQSLPAVLSLVENLSGERQPVLPDPPLDRVVPPGERVATREVAECLGISMERAHDALRQHQEDGILEREDHATGTVWRRVQDSDDRPVVRVW